MHLTEITRELVGELHGLSFSPPVVYVYRPLEYAWAPHEELLRRYGRGSKKVLLLGMNPGPWGMAQTGIPFGTISLVRDWIGLESRQVGRPIREHPRRPVRGFECRRDEVSGARLWGWARDRFETPERFFRHFWVANYCPLLFLDEGGRNLTPDRLRIADREAFAGPCDRALRRIAAALEVRWVVGVGAYAEARARSALSGKRVEVGRILHPSPASPAANRGWSEAANRQLEALGLAELIPNP